VDSTGAADLAWYIAPPLLINADSNPSSLSVNKSLKGKYATLACHETGSFAVQVQLNLSYGIKLGYQPDSARR
jgi:hypothetical protein